jgi:hypothetical protein
MPDDDYDDVDRLTSLIPWLRAQGYDVDRLTYREVRERAQDAAIPAHQGSDRIWQFSRRNTPAIVRGLRLKLMTPPPRLGRQPKTQAAA